MPIMNGDGKEVKVMYSGLVADTDVNITVCGRHVCCNIKRDREHPALQQNIHDALKVHCTDETIIAADNPLRT